MAAGFTARLNGNLYDITTMSVSIGGTPFPRGVFGELNWSTNQTSGKFEGNSQTPTGRTPGHADGKGSAKMLISYFIDFCQQIINLGYPQVMGVDFDITLTYLVNQFGPTATNNTYTVNLQGCRLDGDLQAATSGTDPNVAELSLLIDRVEINGIPMIGGVDDATPF